MRFHVVTDIITGIRREIPFTAEEEKVRDAEESAEKDRTFSDDTLALKLMKLQALEAVQGMTEEEKAALAKL